MKTIAYVRVSTDKQTVENQKAEINNYAVKNKMIIDEFIDIEVSSRKSKKDRKIEELLNKLNKGDTLIVSELSRLGRSTVDVLTTIEELNKMEITVILIKQNMTLGKDSDQISKILVTLFAMFAELERDLISQRTKEALKMRSGNGQILGRLKDSLSKSQYDTKDNEILQLFNKEISASAIVRIIGYGSPKTLLEWKNKRTIYNPLLDELVFNEKYINFVNAKKELEK